MVMNSALQIFLNQKDPLLFNGNLAILCNQISFDFKTNKYLFEILHKRGNLKKVFIPEHGLFAEFQDQVKLDHTEIYHFFNLHASFISLYGKDEDSIYIKKILKI